MTLILTRPDLLSLVTLVDCLPVIENVFRAYGDGTMAPPSSMGVHGRDGTFHVKAAIGDVFAMKINANFPANPARHHLPTIQGVIVLMDTTRGTPLAIMDSALITTLRTAAATAVAAKYLSRAGATTVTIIGCGVQGRASLDALRLVRRITKVYAVDADPVASERFARDTGAVMSSLEAAVADSDIVVTCTPAHAPILDRQHLHDGVFIAGVGADNPQKHELTPALLRDAKVVVDILDQAATMGDLHHALTAGVMTRDDVHGELADVICGRAEGRTSDAGMFVFDSTGTALQDVAVASLALARATERGAGLAVEFA